MMTELAHMHEEDLRYDVARLGQSLEPLLLIMMSGLVLVMMLGIFLPLWDLGQAAKH
jgi:MSHA biogenesis protein MshG